MSSNADPAGVKSLKKKVYRKIDPVLEKYGFDRARSGSNIGIREFNSSTGFWKSGITSKPPRWLIHFVQHKDKWEAKLPNTTGSDRVGYYNVSRRDNVAAFCVRIVPVMRDQGEWTPYEEWEWLMMIFLPKPLQGSSSEVISGFTPPDTTIECKDEKIEPLAIHFYSLCEPGLSCTLSGVELTYSVATERLKEMFEGEKQNGGLFGD